MDVPAYAATLLEDAAHAHQAEAKSRSLEEFEKTLDRIAQFLVRYRPEPSQSLRAVAARRRSAPWKVLSLLR